MRNIVKVLVGLSIGALTFVALDRVVTPLIRDSQEVVSASSKTKYVREILAVNKTASRTTYTVLMISGNVLRFDLRKGDGSIVDVTSPDSSGWRGIRENGGLSEYNKDKFGAYLKEVLELAKQQEL